MSKRILIVEDETDLAQILAEYLQRDGFVATTIADGLLAMAELRQAPPDLLLLDLMLPGMDGIAILRELRKTSELPVIMVTARTEEIDRLLGLELGADDYICKPYSPREVVARVKTVLRRAQPASAASGSASASGSLLEIDADTMQARVAGKNLELTPKEFRLLQTLAAKPGRVFSRAQLLDALYADNLEVSERAIDSHLKNLRKKLAPAFPDEEPIRSIYGVGFAFESFAACLQPRARLPQRQAGNPGPSADRPIAPRPSWERGSCSTGAAACRSAPAPRLARAGAARGSRLFSKPGTGVLAATCGYLRLLAATCSYLTALRPRASSRRSSELPARVLRSCMNAR